MKNISNWIALVMVLMLSLILLCYYVLQQQRAYTNSTIELVTANDSLKEMNSFLSAELEKIRKQMKESETSSTFQQPKTISN